MNFTGLFEEISGTLKTLAGKEEIGKIIVYTPPEKNQELETCGYMEEGIIRGYFAGKDCYIFSIYPEHLRGVSFHKEKEDRIIEECLKKDIRAGKARQKQESSRKNKSRRRRKQKDKIQFPEEYTIRPAVQADAIAMAMFYRKGFHASSVKR